VRPARAAALTLAGALPGKAPARTRERAVTIQAAVGGEVLEIQSKLLGDGFRSALDPQLRGLGEA
jgi:hypothetical protein